MDIHDCSIVVVVKVCNDLCGQCGSGCVIDTVLGRGRGGWKRDKEGEGGKGREVGKKIGREGDGLLGREGERRRGSIREGRRWSIREGERRRGRRGKRES